MKDAAQNYFLYGVLTIAIWIALNALGLLPSE